MFPINYPNGVIKKTKAHTLKWSLLPGLNFLTQNSILDGSFLNQITQIYFKKLD